MHRLIHAAEVSRCLLRRGEVVQGGSARRPCESPGSPCTLRRNSRRQQPADGRFGAGKRRGKPAQGNDGGFRWSTVTSDSWPTPANSAAPRIRLRCTTSGRSKTSTPRAEGTHREWALRLVLPPPEAPRRLRRLPRRPSTTAEAPRGRHDEHWRAGCHGNRARPGSGLGSSETEPNTATSPATYFII